MRIYAPTTIYRHFCFAGDHEEKNKTFLNNFAKEISVVEIKFLHLDILNSCKFFNNMLVFSIF